MHPPSKKTTLWENGVVIAREGGSGYDRYQPHTVNTRLVVDGAIDPQPVRRNEGGVLDLG
jgi:hypothetical protein